MSWRAIEFSLAVLPCPYSRIRMQPSSALSLPLNPATPRLAVAPRYAKMLALARHYDTFDLVLAVVACLTVKVRAEPSVPLLSPATKHVLQPVPLHAPPSQNVFRHNSSVEDDITKEDESDSENEADEEESAQDKAEKLRAKRQKESTWKLAALEVRRGAA